MNDAVAWGLIGRRDLVKQLGAHHVRPTLIDSNPTSVGPGVEHPLNRSRRTGFPGRPLGRDGSLAYGLGLSRVAPVAGGHEWTAACAMLDWKDCSAVEHAPERINGAWVFKGRLAFRLFCEEFRNRFGENVLEASDSDIEKLIGCSFEYGQGGFQEQAKTAADRGTK